MKPILHFQVPEYLVNELRDGSEKTNCALNHIFERIKQRFSSHYVVIISPFILQTESDHVTLTIAPDTDIEEVMEKFTEYSKKENK